MIVLYHYYLCSSSRFVRLVLEEYKIKYISQLENYWRPQKEFLLLNPAGHLPVLVNEDSYPIVGANSCIEYFKQLNLKPNLFYESYKDIAEFYRLYHWFDVLFRKEVLDPILYEKVYSRIVDNITPNSGNIRDALQNLDFHLRYFDHLIKNKNWFVGDNLTYADLIASANLSILDYLGLLEFGNYQFLKEWYLKNKSRPAFQTLLKDQIVGLTSHENYRLIDI